jgi:hypothetical protein
LTLSPNPTQGVLNYTVENQDFTEGNLSIYDLSGRLIVSKKLSDKIGALNVENLGAGEYICVVKSEKLVFFQKFVKIK